MKSLQSSPPPNKLPKPVGAPLKIDSKVSWHKRPLLVRKVAGSSMEPYVGPGAIVVARGFFLRLKKYDVVVVRQNGIEKIKRILHIRDGKLFLIGDNPQRSTDSRHFGWISTRSVIGKVIWPH